MKPVFWLTIEVGKKRVPIPIFLLLPFILVLDMVAMLILLIYGIWKKTYMFVKLGTSFFMFRFALNFVLYGGHFKIGVHNANDTVRVFGGWQYR